MNSKVKIIKELENKASKNQILSSFQLYLNYTHGLDGVPINENLANQYLSQCVDYIEKNVSGSVNSFIPENKLQLMELQLFDYRRFKQLHMKLNANMTVVIGNNGQGKTTILNAISKTLSWINANILKEDGVGQRLSELYDIRRNSNNAYADVLTEFKFGSGLKRFTSRLSRSSHGTPLRRDSDIKSLKDFSNVLRVVNSHHLINLPLCAFYSVERSHPLPRYNKDNVALREERFDAYNSALSGAGRFEHFIVWFIALHKKSINDKSDEIEALKQQVKDLQTSVKSGIVSLQPILNQTQEQLSNALSLLKLSKENKKFTDAQTKDIVVKAICKIIRSISDIWVDTTSGSDVVLVKNDSLELTIEQLSDGQRTFLGLIGDLVRRLVMLNPKLNNPLEGQGIVLIDEIELHLHPTWQQNVLLDLQSCFPNIQFIVTTHSPIVLSTVDKDCIHLLQFDNHGIGSLDSPRFQTKGVCSSDILEEIMGTFSVPSVPEATWLSDYYALIIQDLWKSDKGKKLFEQIIQHFGADHPEIMKIKGDIRTQEFKLKVKALKGS